MNNVASRKEILRAALNSAAEIHAALSELRAGGVAKEDLYADLVSLRSDKLEQQQEDVVLEGMDFLSGFSSPETQIE